MTEVVKTDPVTEDPKPAEVVTPTVPKPGEKTDPALLLKSLQEERAKVRNLETELEALRKPKPADDVSPVTVEVFSDEGKVLADKITQLSAEIEAQKFEKALASVQAQFPALKDKEAEFEEYRHLNPGMKLETAAKAFLAENNLLEAPPVRKGLESSTGGPRAPIINDGKMTAEEVDNLRVTNYKEYVRRLKAGEIQIR